MWMSLAPLLAKDSRVRRACLVTGRPGEVEVESEELSVEVELEVSGSNPGALG